MPAILKEDVLRRKNAATVGKEKVDKIMDTIAEPTPATSQIKANSSEDKVASESLIQSVIFSDETLMDGENSAAFEEIKGRLKRELKPSNEIEAIFVDRIVSSVWRLKRCLKIEREIMEYMASRVQDYEQQGLFRMRKRTDKEVSQLKAFKVLEDKGRMEELSRYESTLELQIYRALRALDRARRPETGKEKRLSKKTRQ